jgi:dihydroflavonol-4-reductase
VPALAVVTGASGVVGGAVARHLLDGGYEVRAIARSRAAAQSIGSIVSGDGLRRVDVVEGDVLEPASLEDAFRGADVVLHAAGIVAACRRDPSLMLRTNVIGTRNAVTAAGRAGVRRFLLTSSAATIGQRSGEVGREDTPHRGWFLSAYERSKAEAESAAFALGREVGLEVVCVNPASVQGPGRRGGTARLLAAAARGRLPVVVRSTISFVDVDDCARGHVLALERGGAGRRYLLCGASMSVLDALELVARVTGRRRRPIVVPASMIRIAAAAVESVFELIGRDAPLCREIAAAIEAGRRYDGSQAARELGLEYTDPETTVRRAVEWLSAERPPGGSRRRRAAGEGYHRSATKEDDR